METNVIPQFHDPSTAAQYLGESVGTHYSAALRAAKAYGTHLAAKRERLLDGTYEGENLGAFWRELIKAEQVRLGSPRVLKGLATTPDHYFSDFLDTAEAVYLKRYKGSSSHQKKGQTKSEHAQCLRFLRDHSGSGKVDHFTLQNKISTWMQLLRMMGRYQE
jgi:hypothetical protein